MVDTFDEELCEAFVVANIPLAKLNNPKLKHFLEKCTHKHIPDESTLRRFNLPKCYSRTISDIRANLSEQYIWISTDKTVDILGRCIVNVIVNNLQPTHPQIPCLLATIIVEHVDAETIAKVVETSISELFQSHDDSHVHSKVLLFVSDSEAYMLKAGKLF